MARRNWPPTLRSWDQMSDPFVEPAAHELAAERATLERMRMVHARQLARALAHATRLSDDAAEATEDGIRDLMDEDAEADAAIQAAIVRQTSNRALQAIRRYQDLLAAGDALAFGHLTRLWPEGTGRTMEPGGEKLSIGRRSVIDGDEVLLVDWRAPAAAPFYQATPLEPMGVSHRRHLNYRTTPGAETADPTTDPDPTAELIGWSDEVFDMASITDPTTRASLRGEAAILAAIEAPTGSQMRSVVATIQAEQDKVIRAPANRPLVVQGGPGTGKTVVALHRAAYLLYNQRAALAESGVLIVGPSTEFLSYISGVLPSLGETGVVSVTASELYSGVLTGGLEPARVAGIKGQARMADLLANAVRDRQRPPTGDLVAWYGSDRVRLTAKEIAPLYEVARRFHTHNAGADAYRLSIIEAFAAKVFNPSFSNYEDAFRTFAASRPIRHFLTRNWPTLTPEQMLNDLLSSPALLRLAARQLGFSQRDLLALERPRTLERNLDQMRFSPADLPLLDELLALLGSTRGDDADDQRIRERDEATEFEMAEALDAAFDSVDDDDEPQDSPVTYSWEAQTVDDAPAFDGWARG